MLIYAVDIDIVLFILHLFSVIFAYFLSVVAFLLRMEECADFTLVAPGAVAVDPFVLIWVIESLNSCVTFVAKQALWALLPA